MAHLNRGKIEIWNKHRFLYWDSNRDKLIPIEENLKFETSIEIDSNREKIKKIIENEDNEENHQK